MTEQELIKLSNYKYKVTKPFGRIKNNKNGNYLDGEVVTKHGIVTVYSQGFCGKCPNFTRLDMVVNGELYIKNFKQRYSARYLVTLANKFASALIAMKGE